MPAKNILKIEEYTSGYGIPFMKIYVKDIMVFDGAYDKYKISLVKDVIAATKKKN